MASRDLSVTLANLINDTDIVHHKIPELSEMNVENWNDATLMKLREHTYFPFKSHMKNILSRFYNLYFCGQVAEADSVLAVISDAVAIVKLKNKMIWGEDAFSGNSFYRSEYIINDDVGCIHMYDGCNIRNIIQYQCTDDDEGDCATHSSSNIVKYSDIDIYKFQDLVSIFLEDMHGTSYQVHEENNLVGLTGFLALTLWRAATHDEVQLGNTFCTKYYRIQLSYFVEWPVDKAFSPPSKECIHLALTHLRRGLASTSSMFIMLAAQYVTTRATAPDVANLLSGAVLNYTARYGLEILDLLNRVTRVTHLKWTELCKATYLNVTADTWDLIKLFFVTFLQRDSVEYSYNWARIIDNQYLKEYSLENALPLAGIFVGILEHYEGNKIWNAKLAKKHKEIFSEMKTFGKNIYTKSINRHVITANVSTAIFETFSTENSLNIY